MQVTLMLISFESYPLKSYQKEIGQILVCCMTNISSMFWLNAGDWKPVSSSFILLK